MKPKILVVEDNVLTRAVVTTLFENLGFEVKSIALGDDAIPYVRENQVDVIILDLELPGMNGDEIYTALQQDEYLKNIPIIPFSAHSDEGAFGKVTVKTVLKLPETVIPMGDTDQLEDTNEILINEVVRALEKKNVAFPPELEAYLKGRKK